MKKNLLFLTLLTCISTSYAMQATQTEDERILAAMKEFMKREKEQHEHILQSLDALDKWSESRHQALITQLEKIGEKIEKLNN